MHYAIILFWILFQSAIGMPGERSSQAHEAEVPVFDYDGLEQYLKQYADRTVVVNFWATWCVPCVKELPYFEKVTERYDEREVVVILVSLDFSDQLERRVLPFLERHNIRSQVVLLDDPDANRWIELVHPSWSGAIPGTLFKNKKKEVFFEKSFSSFDEINQIVQSLIKT